MKYGLFISSIRKAESAVIIAVMLTGLLTPAFGQAKAPEKKEKPQTDPRVAQALTDVGYKYVITELGNYRVRFTLDDKREHFVFISTRTEKFGALETRKIWASVMSSKDLLTKEQANQLLMENIPQKVGAYELTKEDEGGYKVMYAAKVDANCNGKFLKEAVRLVMLVADSKEKELTGKDEF